MYNDATMSERIYPSRRQLAHHIAFASQEDGKYLGKSYGCAQIVMAFTHGDVFHKVDHSRLNAREPDVIDVLAADYAQVSSQNLIPKRLDFKDPNFKSSLIDTISLSDMSWIIYNTRIMNQESNQYTGHAVGVIPSGVNQYVVCDPMIYPSKFIRATSERIYNQLAMTINTIFSSMVLYTFINSSSTEL